MRFDIDAHIQGDASDGIGETKIFCFDMTVLLSQMNHNVKFVMHDNRLFQGIDPRQRAELFRIANELTLANGYQYVASLNDHNLLDMKSIMEPAEFESIFSSNTVLELTDDSEAGKLLGITVDLDYDRENRKED